MDEHNDLGRQTVLANLLQIPVHILGELAEEHTEQRGKQRTGQIEPFPTEMVTIVELSPFQRRHD